MREKDLYCLGLHFKHLYEQRIYKMPFDFAEPCENCKYIQSCKCDWGKMRDALKQATGIDVIVVSKH